jgi:hypothetical protein
MPPIMLVIIISLALLSLVVKLPQRPMLFLAFILWLIGGVVLIWTGVNSLEDPSIKIDNTTLLYYALGAAVIGWAKGKFILAKTSQKNIDRLTQINEPLMPIHVYSIRSWIVITLMVLISLSLTWFEAPLEWRGLIRLGVGIALVVSSLNYLKVPKPTSPTAAAL